MGDDFRFDKGSPDGVLRCGKLPGDYKLSHRFHGFNSIAARFRAQLRGLALRAAGLHAAHGVQRLL
ncbi:hypothetical protein BZG24_29310, partial [Escherichia coli]|nr:hypothetical protein [Escherichia coli]